MTQDCCCWSLMAMIFSCCWAKRCISVCRKPSDVFSLSMERVYSAKGRFLLEPHLHRHIRYTGQCVEE